MIEGKHLNICQGISWNRRNLWILGSVVVALCDRSPSRKHSSNQTKPSASARWLSGRRRAKATLLRAGIVDPILRPDALSPARGANPVLNPTPERCRSGKIKARRPTSSLNFRMPRMATRFALN